jgi:periplasmic divalent cation tolerance protein
VNDDCLQVTVAAASREEADRITRTAVEERLAACGQVIGPVTSTYRWEGKVARGEEWICVLKTTRARFPELRYHVLGMHGYRVPEIIATAITAGAIDYLEWIHAETASPIRESP